MAACKAAAYSPVVAVAPPRPPEVDPRKVIPRKVALRKLKVAFRVEDQTVVWIRTSIKLQITLSKIKSLFFDYS